MTISRSAAVLILLPAVFLALHAGSADPADRAAAWRVADPEYTWSFPRDHWVHPDYRTEWWYFTGHLTEDGETSPRFGYQFTFFRVGIAPGEADLESDWASRSVIMGHASITDLETDRHVFSDVLYRNIPLLGGFGEYPDTVIAWCRGPAGTADPWRLTWNGSAFDFFMRDADRGIAFALSTTPAKPLIFQGPDGFSRKGAEPSNASQYYSFTRLRTEGTVWMDTDSIAVSGESWMDKEFGSNQLSSAQVGWDWFSLQLDDGREIMIYELRRESGEVDFARATVVGAGGSVRFLEAGSWSARATGHWTSPVTKAPYPSGWEIEIPSESLELRVTPLRAGQENVSDRSSGIYYWEGAVTVDGDSTSGRGYVELTGYGGGNRPAL